MATASPEDRDRRRLGLTLVALLLVALNLRPALTSVSPVLQRIGDSLALSPVMLGLLTTLPVLCLGLAAPVAPRAARRLGSERAVLAALLVLALALLVRPYTGTPGLFAGTALAGGCIGVLGVLLPGLVKRDFPERVSAMTGLYTMTLCLGAATAAGATEPLRLILGEAWRGALALWLTPALAAAVIWGLQPRAPAAATRDAGPRTRLMRDPLAWQVTLFMGSQSALAYSVFGWLPTILADRGLAPVTAGLALSCSILVQLISALAAPALGARMRDQRAVSAGVMALVMIGVAGCIFAPLASIWLWIAILGLGQGGSFAMGLTLIAVRARDADTAADLSAMAQGVGYVLAAAGPLLVGLLHEAFGGWGAVGVALCLIAAASMILGLGAGRRAWVGHRDAA
ncbi:CynX/NimT family MFS transporter [Salinisphaera orenii]|uniref:MFS transporter n=1 Tax=Salinisphaera orenii YIM 95161 TaxID=1051139 RepID=A0A423Q0F0_9GAMM|nr:MFS transporter [Salinisphaera halophila]ROO31352.1 MFS transporter [Salinisphaera halophila YIM 95161]